MPQKGIHFEAFRQGDGQGGRGTVCEKVGDAHFRKGGGLMRLEGSLREARLDTNIKRGRLAEEGLFDQKRGMIGKRDSGCGGQ